MSEHSQRQPTIARRHNLESQLCAQQCRKSNLDYQQASCRQRYAFSTNQEWTNITNQYSSTMQHYICSEEQRNKNFDKLLKDGVLDGDVEVDNDHLDLQNANLQFQVDSQTIKKEIVQKQLTFCRERFNLKAEECRRAQEQLHGLQVQKQSHEMPELNQLLDRQIFTHNLTHQQMQLLKDQEYLYLQELQLAKIREQNVLISNLQKQVEAKFVDLQIAKHTQEKNSSFRSNFDIEGHSLNSTELLEENQHLLSKINNLKSKIHKEEQRERHLRQNLQQEADRQFEQEFRSIISLRIADLHQSSNTTRGLINLGMSEDQESKQVLNEILKQLQEMESQQADILNSLTL